MIGQADHPKRAACCHRRPTIRECALRCSWRDLARDSETTATAGATSSTIRHPAITYRGHGSISNMPVIVPCRFSVRDNSLLATSGQGGALPQRRDSLVAGSQKINGEMHC